ncbi:hypothetical protein SNEBB_000487 [Seison nebaliae]|nr:hypothetical protein SNEBB_000487 [Seison nebaliae]
MLKNSNMAIKCLAKSIDQLINEFAIKNSLIRKQRRDVKESKTIKRKWNSLSVVFSERRKLTDLNEMIVNDEKIFSSINQIYRQCHLSKYDLCYSYMSFADVLIPGKLQKFENNQWKLEDCFFSLDNVQLCRKKLMSDCEIENRNKCWRQLLNLSSTDHLDILTEERLSNEIDDGVMIGRRNRQLYYNELYDKSITYQFALDAMLIENVHASLSDSDEYFVFEDYFYQMVLMMIRDERFINKIRSNLDLSTYSSDIFCFHKDIVKLFAPICFVFDNVIDVYFAFTHLYSTYFYQLHWPAVQGMVSLIHLFHSLLEQLCKELKEHLIRSDVNIYAYFNEWSSKGFVGVLPVQQVLCLWDRVISYNSLNTLAMFTVGVLWLRNDLLLSISNKVTLIQIISDFSSINVNSIFQLIFNGF